MLEMMIFLLFFCLSFLLCASRPIYLSIYVCVCVGLHVCLLFKTIQIHSGYQNNIPHTAPQIQRLFLILLSNIWLQKKTFQTFQQVQVYRMVLFGQRSCQTFAFESYIFFKFSYFNDNKTDNKLLFLFCFHFVFTFSFLIMNFNLRDEHRLNFAIIYL